LKREFEALSKETFDLIVIGGGIIGAGIARDAVLRGIHTLLVEKEDFAYGTTSRSSRLIHGGLRYLRQLEFGLVRQDLREREILLRIAPHLVHRLPFVIPLFRNALSYRLSLPCGMLVYDILSRGKSLPSCQRYSRSQTLEAEPGLSEAGELIGSYLYYDCQAEYVERLCLENIISGAENGACVLNHAEMTALLVKDNTVQGIEVWDKISGETYHVRGRVVLNAAGPWADLVWGKVSPGKMRRLRRTKGIHMLTDRLSRNALVLFAKSDGRLFFVIPWQDYSLIGTTDTDYPGNPDTVCATVQDVDYLCSELRHYFPGFRQEGVYYTQAGLRALVSTGGKSESDNTRAHKLVDFEQENGIKGFISIIGGKITAYRAVAEEAVDMACRKLGVKEKCLTAIIPLPGASRSPQTIEQAGRESGLSNDTIGYLKSIYGSRFTEVTDLVRHDRSLGKVISHEGKDILAQVHHAVEKEYAFSVSDYLLRRSPMGIGPSQGMEAAGVVAGEMGRLLGWSVAERESQISAYRRLIEKSRSFKAITGIKHTG